MTITIPIFWVGFTVGFLVATAIMFFIASRVSKKDGDKDKR